jgi:multiple sugar transport system ATP-binding protein
MAQVVFAGVTKRFGDTVAVDDLNLAIEDSELLVLLGSSGGGKTTALRMVAGLEEISAGTRIGDQVVNDIDRKDRDVAMVFQSYALYPHLTVAKNIEFPLRQRGVGRDDRAAQVAGHGVHPRSQVLGPDGHHPEALGDQPGLQGGLRPAGEQGE